MMPRARGRALVDVRARQSPRRCCAASAPSAAIIVSVSARASCFLTFELTAQHATMEPPDFDLGMGLGVDHFSPWLSITIDALTVQRPKGIETCPRRP
jgi:hypothetical protein